MTGYGRASVEGRGLAVQVELRSVNHRFADVRLRLPSDLLAHEAGFKRRIAGGVARGRVDATIGISRDPLPGAAALNEPLAAAALGAARALRERHQVEGEPSIADLLALPGMLDTDSSHADWDEEQLALIGEAIDTALAAWNAEREREGEALRRDLVARIAKIDGHVAAIESRAAGLPDGLRQKLLDRLEELAPGVELDPARLAQEATFLADRADVTEELVRLRGHLERLAELFGEPDGEAVGKRADFLLQEIHRETNTVNSKSADLTISRDALAIKLEAEKVREQIQNLE